MIKRFILVLLAIVVVKVCFAQQTQIAPMQPPPSASSFTNLLIKSSIELSNTDLQIINSTTTPQSTLPIPPTPPVVAPRNNNNASSSSDDETIIPGVSLSIPGVSDEDTTASTPAPSTSTNKFAQDSLKLIQSLNSGKTMTQKQQPKPVVNSAEALPAIAKTPQEYNTLKYDSLRRAKSLSEVYGKEFFQGQTLKTFNKSSDAIAPDDYVLGVGDKISVSVWGYSSYNQAFVVDNMGAINPTESGRIYVKGLTFKDAKALMTQRFGQVFDLHNSQIDFTIVYARDITVNIVGEVVNPGSYHIPAVNTAFNALIAAGGVNSIGSVRNIFIKRDGKTIKTLDVYKFLQDPNSNEDFFLQNNDYIFVPAANKIVKMGGEVYRPMSYELKDNENLNDVIKYAGGLKADAYTKSIQVTRYQNSHAEIIDINLDSLTKFNKDYALVNGDKIIINPLPSQLFTYLEISGPVKIPGRYEYVKGMRISDLLAKSQGVTEEAYLDFGYVVRTLPDLSKQYIPFVPKNVINDAKTADNIVLQNQDVVDIFQKTNFVNNLTVTINGAVHTPGSYTFGQGLTLRDLLLYAGGLLPTAANNRIEISRIMNSANGSPPFTNTPAIVKIVQIGSDLTIDQSSGGFQLQPYDIIFVRQAPGFTTQTTVSLSGEVLYPGTYTILNKGEKIASLIKRAGGPTAWAYLENATVRRPQDSIGFVISNLKKALKDTNSKFNVLIKPGDSISVPTVNDLVTITGAVNYPFLGSFKKVSVPYHKGWRGKHYVKTYGDGFAENAWRTHSYVIQAGGYVQKVHRFLVFNIYPKVQKGGGVYVEYKQEAITPSLPKTPVNWTTVIKDTTTKLVGLLTLYILVQRLTAQ